MLDSPQDSARDHIATPTAYRGTIRGGVVVFDGESRLAEGTPVEVVPMLTKAASAGIAGSLLEELGDLVGSVEELPADYARNHDHYIHGTPKA